MATIVGNDISKWQGDIDWPVYKDHTNFCIIKSSEGVGFTDPKFSRNQSEGRRVGVPLGYYHFARPDLGNSPEAEADWFLTTIGMPVAGEIYCLDYEPPVQVVAHVDWCLRWLNRVKEKTGVKCFVYLNQSQVKKFNWKPVVDGDYALWIAAYTYDPMKNDFVTGAWSGAAMQQWTNQQIVPGITGKTDGNVFFGTITAFKKYGYQVTPATPPPPSPPSADLQAELDKVRQTLVRVANTMGVDPVEEIMIAEIQKFITYEDVIRAKDQALQTKTVEIASLSEQVQQLIKEKDSLSTAITEAQIINKKQGEVIDDQTKKLEEQSKVVQLLSNRIDELKNQIAEIMKKTANGFSGFELIWIGIKKLFGQ